MGGEGNPLGVCKKIKIWPCEQVVHAQPRICLWEWNAQTPLRFLRYKKKKKTTKKKKHRICPIVDFAVPADHRMKIKESEKKEKYLDLAKELKKNKIKRWRWCQLWLVHLGQSPRGLVKGLEDLEISGQVDIPSRLQHYWEYWEDSWKLEKTCCHSTSSGKPSANAIVKKSQNGIIINA